MRTDRARVSIRMAPRHMSIEFTRRDKIQFSPALAIRYETTADQLRYLLAEIRRMLYEHPKVESNSAAYASPISIAARCALRSAYVLTRDSNEFIAIRETSCCGSWDRRKIGHRFRFPVADLVFFARFRSRQGENRSAEHRCSNGATNTTAFPDFAAEDKSTFATRLPILRRNRRRRKITAGLRRSLTR